MEKSITLSLCTPRRLPDPVYPNAYRYIGYLPINKSMPQSIPVSPSPYSDVIETLSMALYTDNSANGLKDLYKKFASQPLTDTLYNNNGLNQSFHLLNKGITLFVSSAKQISETNNKENLYSLTLRTSDENYLGDGIVDGAYTYYEILKYLKNKQYISENDQQYVMVNIFVGYPPEFLNTLSISHNYNVCTKPLSLGDYYDMFTWMHTPLGEYKQFINLYDENNDNNESLISGIDLLKILECLRSDIYQIPSDLLDDTFKVPNIIVHNNDHVLKNYMLGHTRNVYEKFSSILKDIVYITYMINFNSSISLGKLDLKKILNKDESLDINWENLEENFLKRYTNTNLDLIYFPIADKFLHYKIKMNILYVIMNSIRVFVAERADKFWLTKPTDEICEIANLAIDNILKNLIRKNLLDGIEIDEIIKDPTIWRNACKYVVSYKS